MAEESLTVRTQRAAEAAEAAFSHVPCIHVYGSDGNVVFSIFQDGLSRLILRPETGVRIVNGVRLPNGEYAYAVEGN